jgi:hypothetical protein
MTALKLRFFMVPPEATVWLPILKLQSSPQPCCSGNAKTGTDTGMDISKAKKSSLSTRTVFCFTPQNPIGWVSAGLKPAKRSRQMTQAHEK